MEKIRILTRNSIKKNKGQYCSLALIIVIASLMFTLGVTSKLGFEKSFDEKWDKYNAAEYFNIVSQSDYSDDLLNKIKNVDGVKYTEKRECILIAGDIKFGENEMSMPHVFHNMDDIKNLDQVGIVEKATKEYNNPIYISYWMKSGGGYNIGDQFKFKTNDKDYEFTVAGFVEDMNYGRNAAVGLGVYLNNDDYNKLKNQVDQSKKAVNISCDVDNLQNAKEVSSKIGEILTKELKSPYRSCYYEVSKNIRIMTANVIEMMLIAFAVIIVLVSLLVSNFRINNSISEEMQNMGALKAMGYSGKQIILSVICPYILTGIIAAIIGSSLSFLVLPVFESALNSQTGLLWEEGFNIKSIILTVVVIFTLVTIIAYSSARKIKHLKPITALRDGVKTHNFKKNYFPIETTKGNINLIIALKNLIRYLKQNILLLIVSIVVSLAIIFTEVLFYNICYVPKPFLNAINEEIPSVSFNITDSEKKNEIKNSIEKLDSVNKTLYYDSDNVSVKGEKTPTIIVEDYSLLENNLCYEGRNPEHDNEVALGNVLAKDKNLSIGDTVEINFSGNSKKYLITGLIQHVDNNGIVCEFTKEGFSKINNNFSPSNLYVYLNDEDKAEEVVNEVIDRYGDNIGSQVNYVKTREAAMGVFLNIAGLILVIIVVATTLIITLILYLLIKTSITNRKQEIGILKSIGYTTWQLIMQTTFSFLPTIIVGSVLGSIIGYFKMNSIILMIFKSIGVMRMQLYIPGFVVITSALAIIIVSFIISILISKGIKKISAYSLIKE